MCRPQEFAPLRGSVALNEPIGRMANGRWLGKPHWVEAVVRMGGEVIYIPNLPRGVWQNAAERERVTERIGSGLTEAERQVFFTERPDAMSWPWRSFVRNALVYARGTVRHPDHKTIVLRGWHRVVPNTELEARAMALVAFID